MGHQKEGEEEPSLVLYHDRVWGGLHVGFCDGSCHMQVMVLPWHAWGRGLLWDSTSDPSGLSHLETWY